jgi:hypothetical protein
MADAASVPLSTPSEPISQTAVKQPNKKKVRIEASKEHAEKMFKFLEEKLPDLTEGNAQKDLPPPVKVPRKRKPKAVVAPVSEPDVMIIGGIGFDASDPKQVKQANAILAERNEEEQTEPIEIKKEEEEAPKRPRRIRHDKMVELIHIETMKVDPYYRIKIGAACAVAGAFVGYSFAPNLNALRYV